MTHDDKRLWLIRYLLEERGADVSIPEDEGRQWKLLRSLMNVRPASYASDEFIEIQDSFLQEETRRKGIADIDALEPYACGLYIWQGDITALRCDAIVNAANGGMTGCYHPCHGCIDNTIHTYAGVQLRAECAAIIDEQGHEEETGYAKITHGWNLPASYVIHTVGPIVSTSRPAESDCALLASCYRSCFELADAHHLGSIAFCCISTGEFRFPHRQAAEIAIDSVLRCLAGSGSGMKVVFNVFTDEDRRIYEELLSERRQA